MFEGLFFPPLGRAEELLAVLMLEYEGGRALPEAPREKPFVRVLRYLSCGGLLIGLIETFWSAYFSVEYKDVAAFSILIVVLIFLPTGLLGRPEVEKV